jgi:hypothetical protein
MCHKNKKSERAGKSNFNFCENHVFPTPLAAHNVGLSQRYAIKIKSLNEQENVQRVDVTRHAERKCNAIRT